MTFYYSNITVGGLLPRGGTKIIYNIRYYIIITDILLKHITTLKTGLHRFKVRFYSKKFGVDLTLKP